MKQSRLPGMGDDGPVDCLGMTFENEDARREHFLGRLKEHLADPEFRKQSGFPTATDESILRLSDPPYYTACPNPFLREFANHAARTEEANYKREPFSADLSGGKGHKLFKVHSYHTKVPPHLIIPFILHYTNPNDLILDGFSGSGMTGVASRICETITAKERSMIDKLGVDGIQWGTRNVILNDLSPIATFISAMQNSSFDKYIFLEHASEILETLNSKLGWMYDTHHNDGRIGRIEFTVWGENRTCPNCNSEIIISDMKTKKEIKRAQMFQCSNCDAWARKAEYKRVYSSEVDFYTGQKRRVVAFEPVMIQYEIRGKRFQKVPDDNDLEVLRRIISEPVMEGVPIKEIPYLHMTHERANMADQGITMIHHFHNQRQLNILGTIWHLIESKEQPMRNWLAFFFEQGIHTLSILNRYRSNQTSQSNQVMNGVYYIPSSFAEISPWYRFNSKLKTFSKTLDIYSSNKKYSIVSTGDCSSLNLNSDSIDYIFTDPPFGENIYYSDLNFLLESWHSILTDEESEAIVYKARSEPKKVKTIDDYSDLMLSCLNEYHRVLKPGRWMSIVFSNSHASVWNALNRAIHGSGFIISTVTTMDTGSGSFRQVTSSAVKANLIVNCFKPLNNHNMLIKSGDLDASWSIMTEHLAQLPVWVGPPTVFTLNIERTPDRLFDRLLSLHLVAERQIPYSKGDFIQELQNRFPKREGMFFTPNQVPVFEQKLLAADRSSGTLPVFMDRRSAIAWLRYELGHKPALLQDLRSRYIAASSSWADKTEPVPELIDLLQDHFVEGENGRWKVPDPKKEAELERAHKTRNLKRFYELVASKGRIKEVHADVILVGFAKCFEDNDLETYSSIRNRLPASVLDDEQVAMYKMMLDKRLDD